jgi:transcriptional regulator with XRE-family HTH domain
MLHAFATASDLRDAVRGAARDRRIALGITQADLAARSGVPLGTLKRFERLGEISLSSLLALAEALDALEGFHALFPLPEARTLEEVERQAERPKRARSRATR